MATSENYRPLIADHGLDFVPIRPDLRSDDAAAMRRIMDPKRGGEFLIRQLLMPAVADTYADLLEPAKSADLLISHVLAFAVPILAEKLGKPWVSIALSPLPATARLRCLGPRLNRWLFRMPRWVSRHWSEPACRFRRELGLPPGPDPLWEGLHSPHLGPAMFSSRFGAPQPDWPANTVVTGFPFLDAADEPVGPELEPFLDAGEPPVVFTLGSAAVRVAGDFYEVAACVSRRLGRRAVLVGGSGVDALRQNLPPNCVATGWASYPGRFSRAAAVVHQGGVGTTAEALRAGVPQLVVPYAHDQFDNGDPHPPHGLRTGAGPEPAHGNDIGPRARRHAGRFNGADDGTCRRHRGARRERGCRSGRTNHMLAQKAVRPLRSVLTCAGNLGHTQGRHIRRP